MSQINKDEQEALNNEAEEINSRVTTPVAEQQAPEEVSEAESTEEVKPTETEGEQPKKGYEARVQELNRRAKAAEAKAMSLEEKMKELNTPAPGFDQQGFNQTPFNPNEPLIAPGEEIDVNELNRRQTIREQRVLSQANANALFMQKQSEAENRLKNELNEVSRIYPELDPDSESFDNELSDTIAEATDAYIKKQPYTASVTKFVAKLMKPYQGAIEKEVGKASENIAKQVSQAALKPTSIRKPEKTAAEMSIAELEAKLGVVQS